MFLSDEDKSKPRVFNKTGMEAIPEDAVYIGRGSPWGNPFRIGPDGSREQVVNKFRVYLRNNPKLVEEAKRALTGKSLVCYCKPLGCHGDVWLEFLYGEEYARRKLF